MYRLKEYILFLLPYIRKELPVAGSVDIKEDRPFWQSSKIFYNIMFFAYAVFPFAKSLAYIIPVTIITTHIK